MGIFIFKLLLAPCSWLPNDAGNFVLFIQIKGVALWLGDNQRMQCFLILCFFTRSFYYSTTFYSEIRQSF